MCIYHMCVGVPRMQKEGLWAWITDGCKLFEVGAGNPTLVLWEQQLFLTTEPFDSSIYT